MSVFPAVPGKEKGPASRQGPRPLRPCRRGAQPLTALYLTIAYPAGKSKRRTFRVCRREASESQEFSLSFPLRHRLHTAYWEEGYPREPSAPAAGSDPAAPGKVADEVAGLLDVQSAAVFRVDGCPALARLHRAFRSLIPM